MKKDRILWADDEIDLLSPYLIFLEEKGYEVVTTTNGKDAVEICRKEHFDIIFLDENMPGLSGLETVAEIKAIAPNVPMVMITKSEEEDIMNLAIGNQIADYLTKPVNPSQILLTLKKNIHQKEIFTEHTTSAYQQDFRNIGMLLNENLSYKEWEELYKKLANWDIQISEAENGMNEMVKMQLNEANHIFGRFIVNNYINWIQDKENRPLMSHDIFKKKVFPLLDKGEKVFFVLVDNFRYDQWLVIRKLLGDLFTFKEEATYCSILPTATQYARNAIFSGLMPSKIKEMYPNWWVDENEDNGKNNYEKELIEEQLKRFRKKQTVSYHKVFESSFCDKVIQQVPTMKNFDLSIIVLNFIDMLSHSRTDSKMMRELANNEKAYRSLTLSWFKHSSTYELFKALARQKAKVILTTDHGTIQVNSVSKVIGDKSINTNLRYKVGKALKYTRNHVFDITKPEKAGLPSPNVSSTYIFAKSDNFFAYPNNYNHYVSYYKNTFQHGGVSLEEMIVPIITMEPK